MTCATLKRTWEFDLVHSPGCPNKRPRYTPMCVSPTSSGSSPVRKYIFDAPKMSPNEIAASIKNEIQRLKRRRRRNPRHGHFTSFNSSNSESSNSESESMAMSPEPPQMIQDSKKDGLFTYKQVKQICSRVVREREEQLREEYDKILNNKLSEQYDMFSKFSRDQIQRHFSPGSTPSYLS